jgi:hypothetical protein
MEARYMTRKTCIEWASFTALGLLLITTIACSNSTKPGAAESEDKPLRKFAQEIKSETTTLTLKPTQQLFMPVTVKNSGVETWAASGTYPVHLSYLWFSGGKQLQLDTTRTFLQSDLPPGGERILKANVTAPPTAGQYILKFTMVQERAAWFSSAGAKTFDIPVTVQ